jgi:hypothetical protein
MYELVVHDQITNYEKRAEAVAAAKALTARADGPVTASVSDGVETLNFREGKLIAYTYETRRPDGKKERDEFDEV